MNSNLPEKARLLEVLRRGGFNVPDFIYVPAEDFRTENFSQLQGFLQKNADAYKVIARSGHPQEDLFKGGTFDSLETYADLSGVQYARKHIINAAHTEKKLSILRQQKFTNAPEIDLDNMGVIVMPFIEGLSVMGKVVGDHWEFGYCRDSSRRFQSEPYITSTPHDRKLLTISKDIQEYLGFKTEIEYIISPDGEINVVQAKDISKIDTLELKESGLSVKLDGLRRIRKRRNYRERPVFVMDVKSLYIEIISRCEDVFSAKADELPLDIEAVLDLVAAFEKEMEVFALKHERFGVLGITTEVPADLFQIANHYLDDYPELQKQLSPVLHGNNYKIDQFLSEADTVITQEGFHRRLCSHDAYGINTVRNPIWSAFWRAERADEVVNLFKQLGYKTGDTIGIDVDQDDIPTMHRL